jgi:hypothetical protein
MLKRDSMKPQCEPMVPGRVLDTWQSNQADYQSAVGGNPSSSTLEGDTTGLQIADDPSAVISQCQ